MTDVQEASGQVVSAKRMGVCRKLACSQSGSWSCPTLFSVVAFLGNDLQHYACRGFCSELFMRCVQCSSCTIHHFVSLFSTLSVQQAWREFSLGFGSPSIRGWGESLNLDDFI